MKTAKETSSANNGLARLSSAGRYSLFSFGDDVIRFATSPRLKRYTRVKKWEDGYLEVGADYGNGEVEDYIDVRAILDNLYYDTDSFLGQIANTKLRNRQTYRICYAVSDPLIYKNLYAKPVSWIFNNSFAAI